ncbi:serpin B [Ruminococcaceae bacterium YRB3002]|nr:serpin B [Ruminococcaceae bacterium YRB3002]
MNYGLRYRAVSAALAATVGFAALTGCSGIGAGSGDGSGSGDVNVTEEVPDIPMTVETEIRELAAGETEDYRGGYLDFSFALLNGCLDSDGRDANVMVSPASVMLALDMTASGAKDATLAQIMALYGGTDDPQGQLSYASYLMKRMNSSDGVKLHAANSMWVNENVLPEPLRVDFVDFVQDSFEAESSRLVFDATARDRINGWVNDNTDGMIPKIVDDLDPTMAMMLINAIAFDGKWKTQYDDNQVHDDIFTSASGQEQQADMLYSTEGIYLENDLATGFAKYYEGGRYAFVVMLPKDTASSAGDMLSSFDGNVFASYLASATREYDVRSRMPEFSCDWGSSIKSQLQALGMKVPFSESADFSGIADTGSENLFIGDVIHKTHIDVDRNGTRAAAVTAVEMYRNAAVMEEPEVKEVFCDRPFAYAIVDMEEGIPLFVGTVNEI